VVDKQKNQRVFGSKDKKRWWLYILKLEGGKWYVGITSKTPEQRFEQHLHGRGAYWTKHYKPIEIELREDLGVVSMAHAEKYEREITHSLMKERGMNNVRGGDLTDDAEYLKRFGNYITKDAWEPITVIALLGCGVIALLILFALKK
jgi:predicted GIY-YIG superfamily endonuclease